MNQPTDHMFKRLFMTARGKVLVLRPDNHMIVAVTDAYLQATRTQESEIIGKSIFDLFHDCNTRHHTDLMHRLTTSLQRVQSLKIPDSMGMIRYSIRLADGTYEERLWNPVNIPIINPDYS